MLGTTAFAFVAGVLSILSPCVLPLLPIVLGAAVCEHRFGPAALSGGVALSFTIIGLFIATIGFAIGLDGDVLRSASAVLLIAIGIILLVPAAQVRFALARKPGRDLDGRRASPASRRGVGRANSASDSSLGRFGARASGRPSARGVARRREGRTPRRRRSTTMFAFGGRRGVAASASGPLCRAKPCCGGARRSARDRRLAQAGPGRRPRGRRPADRHRARQARRDRAQRSIRRRG